MAGVNKVIFVGNVTRDPEMRSTGGGQNVCNFGIAVNEKFGEGKEKTLFINVVCWGRLAELCKQYVTKGKSLYVEGRLDQRVVEKDGIKKTYTDVVARDVQFLSSPKDRAQTSSYDADPFGAPHTPFNDSEMPF